MIKTAEQRAMEDKIRREAQTLDWAEISEVTPEFPEQISRYRELQNLKREIEQEMADLKPALEAAVILAGEGKKTVRWSNLQVTRVVMVREALVAERLVEKGVTKEVLDYATKKTESSYPLVTEVKDNE